MKVIGVNVVGLTRRGFSREAIQALKEAHRFIYRDGHSDTWEFYRAPAAARVARDE